MPPVYSMIVEDPRVGPRISGKRFGTLQLFTFQEEIDPVEMPQILFRLQLSAPVASSIRQNCTSIKIYDHFSSNI